VGWRALIASRPSASPLRLNTYSVIYGATTSVALGEAVVAVAGTRRALRVVFTSARGVGCTTALRAPAPLEGE